MKFTLNKENIKPCTIFVGQEVQTICGTKNGEIIISGTDRKIKF